MSIGSGSEVGRQNSYPGYQPSSPQTNAASTPTVAPGYPAYTPTQQGGYNPVPAQTAHAGGAYNPAQAGGYGSGAAPSGPQYSPAAAPSGPHYSPAGAPSGPQYSPAAAPSGPHYSPATAPRGSHYSPAAAPSGPHYNPAAAPSASYRQAPHKEPEADTPRIPDAVLNMAAKGGPDKTPFAYAPNISSIQQQRDKVRRNLKKDNEKDIQQSPVYRMIHGLDDPGHRAKPAPAAQPHHVTQPDVHAPTRTPKAPSADDEITFSGVNRDGIPSKSFHRLQQMTAESEVDTSSIRPVTEENPEGQVSDYEQASIRYTGKNIPSKSFRMLQTMTGSPDVLSPGHPQPRRMRRRPEAAHDQPDNSDDVVDISYVGGNIPSKAFQFLQQSVGNDPVEPSAEHMGEEAPHPTFSPSREHDFDEDDYLAGRIPIMSGENKDLPPRTREVIPAPLDSRDAPPLTDDEFDEQAYLAGRVSMLGGEAKGSARHQPAPGYHAEAEAELYQGDPDNPTKDMCYTGGVIPSRSFHLLQTAYGKVDEAEVRAVATERRRRRRASLSIQGGTPAAPTLQRPLSVAGQVGESEPAWHDTFDERDYLAGRIPIMGGEAKEVPQKVKVREMAPWVRTADHGDLQSQTENTARQTFDESAFLAGQVNIMGGTEKKMPRQIEQSEVHEVAPWEKRRQTADEEGRPADSAQPFDESTFLARNLGNAGDEQKTTGEDMPSWAKSRQVQMEEATAKALREGPASELLTEDQQDYAPPLPADEQEQPDDRRDFDERAYLLGRVPVIGGGQADLTPLPEPQRLEQDARPAWAKDEDSGVVSGGDFDEEAFLCGRVPVLRQSVDKELPPRDPNRSKKYRERAPWEKANDADEPDEGVGVNGGDFDEGAFLSGRVSTLRKSADRETESPKPSQFADIPSKAFHYLRRSVSREVSPSSGLQSRSMSSQSGYDSATDEEGDPNKAYNNMVYVGKKIPSKTFMRLKRMLPKQAVKKSADPIDRIKTEQQIQLQYGGGGMDVDAAVEKLNMDQPSPDQYMNMLRESVQGTNIKIEPENEVTDF